jgi:hypothetical protein
MRIGRSFSVPLLATMMGLFAVALSVNAQDRAAKPVATEPSGNPPSLDGTLKWLTDFLPTATGATSAAGPDGISQRIVTTARTDGGCKIRVELNISRFKQDGELLKSSRVDAIFSLSDIDAATISDVEELNHVVDVMMITRNESALIGWDDDTGNDNKRARIWLGNLVDRASAKRAVNAFRHASELCAKAQPF